MNVIARLVFELVYFEAREQLHQGDSPQYFRWKFPNIIIIK